MLHTFKKSFYVWFGVMMVFLLLLAANTFISVRIMAEQDRQFYQTGKSAFEMLYNVEEIEKMLGDMETNERGYLLTGNQGYISQFEDAQKNISAHFQSLDLLLPKVATIQQKRDDVRNNIAMWVEEAAMPQISFWQQIYSKQPSPGSFTYLNDKEKDLMASSYASIVGLENAIQQQSNLNMNKLIQSRRTVMVEMYISSGILALYVIFLVLMAYRQKELMRKANEFLVEQDRKLQIAVNELQEISQHKSQFLANVSHELRTPLNSIIGFAQVLQKEFYGPLTENQSRYVTYILTSGQHLLGVINDILDLSKVEAGKMELDLSRFSLKTLLTNAIVMFREKALRHKLTISLDVSNDIGDITADEQKLKQVLFNLLSNAIKFTPDLGDIRISARLATIEHKDYVEIAIADTGIGIPPSEHERIFEPFAQLGGDYVRKNQGTGLGLSLVRRLTELHGGWIRVESEGEGKGSTFYCVFPFKRDEEDKR